MERRKPRSFPEGMSITSQLNNSSNLPGQPQRLAESRNLASERFDAFLAVPMASLSEEAYIAQRRDALRVEECMTRHCGLRRIYNPGAHIQSKVEFDSPADSLTRALDAIRLSRALVMLYNVEKPSSVLVEAGCALAQKIPALYFVRKPLSLPFLLSAAAITFEDVRQHEYESIEEVLDYIEKHGREFLRIEGAGSTSAIR